MTGIDGMVTREQLIMRIFALKRELIEAKERINSLNYSNDRLKHLIEDLNNSINKLRDGKENK